MQPDVDQRAVIDAGFLELVRLGVLPADDSDIENSVSVVDKVIERQTSNGPGFYRYGTNANESADGYGDCFQPSLSTCQIQGEPWPTTNHGTGHLWPVLSGERGEYDIANSDRTDASALLDRDREDDLGRLPRARAGVGERGPAGVPVRL